MSVADVYEKPFPVGTYKGKPAFGHVNRVHCALQWSRDLLHWEPVEELKDFIPLDWTKWDSHLCYASASPVVMGDGTVRLYYGGSSGPHDGVNATTRLGLATLKASDRWVGFKQQSATAATVRVSVLCEGATLLIGADLAGAASLRAGATGLPGLALTDAVELKAADAHGPDVTAKFKVRRRLPCCRVVFLPTIELPARRAARRSRHTSGRWSSWRLSCPVGRGRSAWRGCESADVRARERECTLWTIAQPTAAFPTGSIQPLHASASA